MAAHMRHAGFDVVSFGDPLGFWKHQMPRGMLLRSAWRASFISDPRRMFTLDAYQAALGRPVPRPIPLEDFVAYGEWFQREAVPHVDPRRVSCVRGGRDGFRLELEDGEDLAAERVVIATGTALFARRPPAFEGLPPELVSHTVDHTDLARFAGRRVIVVGGGQSALESAVLLDEGGAEVEVIARTGAIRWMPPPTADGPANPVRGAIAFVKWPPTDVGPPGWNWFVAAPDLFHLMPPAARARIVREVIPPQAADWVRRRFGRVTLTTGRSIATVTPGSGAVTLELGDGTTRSADHVLLGTGFRADVTRLPFLDPGLLARLARQDGYPLLRDGMESTSVPRLHFVGALAAASFGPAMRFVTGGAYAARTLTRRALGRPAAPLTVSW